MRQLVECGVTFTVDSNGESPLHYAARSGHITCVEVLLRHKANVLQASKSKQTPEFAARAAGYHSLADNIKKWHEYNTAGQLELVESS